MYDSPTGLGCFLSTLRACYWFWSIVRQTFSLLVLMIAHWDDLASPSLCIWSPWPCLALCHFPICVLTGIYWKETASHPVALTRRVEISWDSWVAQSVERPTSAQVMISHFVSSSPMLGSMLTAQRLEPASDSVSPSLSLCPSYTHTHTLSLKNKH